MWRPTRGGSVAQKVLLLFIFTTQLMASPLVGETTIRSSQTRLSSDDLTSSHDVMSEEELDQASSGRVADNLSSINGVTVNQSGGVGSPASIYLRGSELRHVMVIVDGVVMNDPSSGDRSFNPAFLSNNDIERIEVLKGAQSVLYGSDAIAGVIHIYTKNPDVTRRSLEMGVGSIGNKHLYGSVSGKAGKKLGYSFNIFDEATDGFSATEKGTENDSSITRGFSGKIQYLLSPKYSYEFNSKVTSSDTETDDGSTLDDDEDKDDITYTDQQIYAEKLVYKKNKNQIIELGDSISKVMRKIKTPPTAEYVYDGEDRRYFANVTLVEKNLKHHFGFVNQKELFREHTTYEIIDRKDVSMNSFFARWDHNYKKNLFIYGFRTNHHEEFGSFGTYTFGVSRKLNKYNILKFNSSSGIKAPSLYQLYGPDLGTAKVGNKYLRPERSSSVETSYIYREGDQQVDTTFHYTDIYNYIEYSSNYGYFNEGNLYTRGVEMNYQVDKNKFKYLLGVSHLGFHKSSGDAVLRRPYNEIKLNYLIKLTDRKKILSELTYTGERKDLDFTDDAEGEEVILESYSLFNLNYIQSLDKTFELKFAIRNIFNVGYQQVYGYQTANRNFFLSLKASY